MLTTICQVSGKPKIGQLIAHKAIWPGAAADEVCGRPALEDTARWTLMKTLLSAMPHSRPDNSYQVLTAWLPRQDQECATDVCIHLLSAAKICITGA